MFDEMRALLDLPGMGLALQLAPVVWAAIWLVLTVLLWRGGFTDLVEMMTRPRWAGAARARAVVMFPLRALLLTVVAGFTAAVTTLGLGFNVAVVISLVDAIRSGS